jgi:hypothetical protein
VTLEQFVATRKWTDDLGAALSDARWEGEPNGRGFLYLDSLYIEQVQDHWPAESKKHGEWALLIGRVEKISNDLPSLEKALWEFAKSEGYFGVAAITDADIEKAAAMDDVDRAAKSLQDIAGITTGDVASHYLDEKVWRTDKQGRLDLLRAWLKGEAAYEE